MKVKEIIEIFKDMDPECNVYVFGPLGDFRVVTVTNDGDNVFIHGEDNYDYTDLEDVE